MKALDRKLLRDAWRLRAQALSIALVMASGIGTFVSMMTTYVSLLATQRDYYAESRLGDVFASLVRAPRSIEPKLREIPGVTEVATRVVGEVTLDLPGVDEPVTAHIVSLTPGGEKAVSALHLREGRLASPGGRHEVVVSQSFAALHRLHPGDPLVATLDGRRQELTVVGLASSPEHVYILRPGEFIPDDFHYAILWMDRDELGAAFGLTNAFDDVVITLGPGAEPRRVLDAVDRVLAPYGGLGANGRDDQASYAMIKNELKQLELMATAIPAIFLAVAAFLVNVVLGRLIGTERTHIATLKALGYSSFKVALHYLELVALVVLFGSILGGVFGFWLGHGMTALYSTYFRFPSLPYRFDPWIIAVAVLVTLLAAVSGTVGGVRGATSLSPAQAMQPPAPPTYRRTLVERIGLGALLSSRARIVLRDIERRPLRTALSTLGISLACAIFVIGAFWGGAIDFAMAVQFNLAQHEDATLTFTKAMPRSARLELEHVPGIAEVETFDAVPCVLRAGHHARRTATLGFRAASSLHVLLDASLRPVALPERGLLLGRRLAERLEVRAGDEVELEELQGLRRKHRVAVAGVVEELFGNQAYMELSSLQRLLGEGQTVSGAFVRIDPSRESEAVREIRRLPGVAGVTLKRVALAGFRRETAQSMLMMTFFLTVFASVLVVGVVYNGARILFTERERELASLRVLGFTRGEVSAMLLGELFVPVVAGVPPGLLLGYLGAVGLTGAMVPDAFSVPVVVTSATYSAASLVVLVAALASALVVRRRLDKLDLVGVLKTRD